MLIVHKVTTDEAVEIRGIAKDWYFQHGSMFCDVRSIAVNAICEFLANQRGKTFYDSGT
jgi:hypothetical protein